MLSVRILVPRSNIGALQVPTPVDQEVGNPEKGITDTNEEDVCSIVGPGWKWLADRNIELWGVIFVLDVVVPQVPRELFGRSWTVLVLIFILSRCLDYVG